MKFEGGCYCGQVRFVAEGAPRLKAQCHCRACQHFTGGAPNLFMLMPAEGFSWTKGEPKRFTRQDLASPVTREFCADCGAHLTGRRPGLDAVIVKVGALDDPGAYGAPRLAIFAAEQQAFHVIPDGMPVFEGLPG